MTPWVADEIHPGWIPFRWAFAAAGAYTWLTRAGQLPGLYSVESPVVLASQAVVRWSPTAVWVWWSVLLVGFALVAAGWRVRAAAGLVLVGLVAMRAGSPDYIFMYDQLLLWQSVALLFHPRGGGTIPGSPFGRHILTLTYVGLYAGTGLSKVAQTLTWLRGDPLAMWLVDSHFGGGPLARWLSVQPALLAVMGTTTILFEAGFALALLGTWTRRAWLGLGVLLHLGILALLEVHTFSYVALAAYPLLVSPEDAEGLRRRLGLLGWLRRRQSSL